MYKNSVKIAIIGGGSSYTPELMEGFIARYEEMAIREIWLVDIEDGREKMEIVGKMAQRMWNASPYNVKIYTTLNRKEALKDADFVTTQFRVGQMNARIKDERIPLSYGIMGQETNGAGGIFKALRTIPVILKIVDEMKVLCPNAWLINFTNPSGMVTEAVMRYGKWEKVLGLCNVPVSAMQKEHKLLDMELTDLTYKFGGLNHFHWHRVFDREGNEVTGKIIENMHKGDDGAPKNIHNIPFFDEQLKGGKAIPCAYHRYYYRQEEMLKFALEEYGTIGTRGEQVKETEEKLFELYKDESLTHKPELLSKRGGSHYSTVACEAIVSLFRDKKSCLVVSTKNNGALPDLDPECVVEVSSCISAAGPLTINFGPLGTAEKGWLQMMKNMELCVCEAAVTGDYNMLLQAFALNPLIPFGESAKQVLNELLVSHKKYLPKFNKIICELEKAGIAVKDEVAANLV